MPDLPPQLAPLDPAAFDGGAAGHLMRRAGFGATPEEADAMVELGLHGCVDRLMDFPDATAAEVGDVPELDPDGAIIHNLAERREALRSLPGEAQRDALRAEMRRASRSVVADAAAWWVGRMAAGPHPLHERLVLFWHGHFTTGARDLQMNAHLVWPQHETLRAHAGGNFGAMVRALARDPAMAFYLNGVQNRRGSPNENFARELMELFTLGVGNYTERDVKEAARAFTGWGTDGETHVFRPRQHDPGPKTVLGQTGPLGGDEVITVLLRHPATAAFLAGKLLRHFVTPDPDPAVAAALADLLRDHDYDLRPAYDALFRSRYFYDPAHRLALVKSPLHLVAGLARQAGVPLPPPGRLIGHLRKMGQIPFNPPTVAGWPEGVGWVNTATLLARQNAAVDLLNQSGRPILDGEPDAEHFADKWLRRLIPVRLTDDRYRTVVAACDPLAEPSARAALQLIVTLPEYQVC